MQASMDPAQELEQLQAECCKGLAHPKRLAILRVLRPGERTVNSLAEELGVSQANLSQHLGVLRKLGLVQARRSGLNIYYSIADPRIAQACELMKGVISEKLLERRLILEVARGWQSSRVGASRSGLAPEGEDR